MPLQYIGYMQQRVLIYYHETCSNLMQVINHAKSSPDEMEAVIYTLLYANFLR
jgi:hypothetical protein